VNTGRETIGGLFAGQASGSTVWSLFAAGARLSARAVALQDARDARRVTYGELESWASWVAVRLHRHGVGAGDRIALLSENSFEYLVVMLAAARVGAILACQNWRLTGRELGHCLALVEPALVLVSEKFRGLLESVPATLYPGSAELPTALALGSFCAVTQDPLSESHSSLADPESPLLILYTSGTTGLPKGAVISHRAEIARNLVLRNEFGLRPLDTFVCWTPLYHMGGADHALGTLMVGGKVIVVDGFAPEALVRAAVSEPLGWLVVMPGVTHQMLEALAGEPRPVKGIRVCGVMPDLIPRASVIELTRRLNAPFVNTFGSTETGSPPASAGLLPIGSLPEKLSKRQSRFCEVRLVDPEGQDVSDGTPGELWMSGPTLFSGYWANEEANREAFAEGWFHMGDVFVRNPDGTLDFVDRAKYLIKSGGENIYPAEIERALLAVPGVSDAAVVRKPDPRWGEVPVAFVSTGDSNVDERLLRERLRTALAGYKQPKAFHFIEFEAFPRSASGKIQRHELERRLSTDD